MPVNNVPADDFCVEKKLIRSIEIKMKVKASSVNIDYWVGHSNIGLLDWPDV
jgi:hypothetical protein